MDIRPYDDYEPPYDKSKKIIKKNLHSMQLEMTRKCNLRCKHCYLGEPENTNISNEIIDSVLDNVQSINMLSLVGGETFLAEDKITYLVDSIIKKNIRLGELNVTTNGTVRSPKIVDAFNRLAEYLDDGLYLFLPDSDEVKKFRISKKVAITISDDIYHSDVTPNERKKTIEYYSSRCPRVSIKNSVETIMSLIKNPEPERYYEFPFLFDISQTYRDELEERKKCNPHISMDELMDELEYELKSFKNSLRYMGRAKELKEADFAIDHRFNFHEVEQDIGNVKSLIVLMTVKIQVDGDVSIAQIISIDDMNNKLYSAGNITKDFLHNIIERQKWKYPIDDAEELYTNYVFAYNALFNNAYDDNAEMKRKCENSIRQYDLAIKHRRIVHEQNPWMSYEKVKEMATPLAEEEYVNSLSFSDKMMVIKGLLELMTK